MTSSIPQGSPYPAFSHNSCVFSAQPTNALELDRAIDCGHWPKNKSFILEWTASKPLSAEALDLLIAEQFYQYAP